MYNELEYQKFRENLFTYQDEKYRDFTIKLTPTKYEVIGIRIPIMRRLAKEISKTDPITFLNVAKSQYFEEVFITALVVASLKDESAFESYLPRIITLIDNWSICDSLCNTLSLPKKNPDKYFPYFLNLLTTQNEYSIRVGLVTILNHFITKNNLEKIFLSIDKISLDTYYVNMAIAWLLCEIYIFDPQKTEAYFKRSKINDFTMNKTISKIRESYRIPKDTKDYLNKYKRKRK